MNRKIQIKLKCAAILLPLAALAIFTSCSSKPPANTGPVTTRVENPNEAGFGGQIIVDTFAATNTVVSIDPATRKIGLRRADGRVTTYTAGTNVVNFDQIKVGDQVRATMVDETAIFMIPASSPGQLSRSGVFARALPGAKPGAASLDTYTVTAKVLSINPWLNQITLQLADGTTKTIPVRNDFINLANFNPGDEVRVRLTQALALLVEQPQKHN